MCVYIYICIHVYIHIPISYAYVCVYIYIYIYGMFVFPQTPALFVSRSRPPPYLPYFTV